MNEIELIRPDLLLKRNKNRGQSTNSDHKKKDCRIV